jgi:hypothetical protein
VFFISVYKLYFFYEKLKVKINGIAEGLDVDDGFCRILVILDFFEVQKRREI